MTTIKYSIGIDISKKDFKACFVVSDNNQEKVKATRTFTNTIKGLNQFKEWYSKHQKESLPSVFVVEATGTYHEQLAWFLHESKQEVSIVLPNRAKAYLISLGIKSKNDKVDAKGLAMMGAVQRLKIWNPISKAIYVLRSLTRHLEDLQKIRTALMNQNEQFNHAMYELKEVSKSLEKTLKSIDLQIENCKKKIIGIIEKDEFLARKASYMTSVKGVAILTVAVVIAETNGFALINNLKQLVSYAGYDVKENQSGTRVGKTRITKKGNAHIRRAMHLPAFNMVTYKNKPFEDLYNRVFEKTGIKMKAYVALQSKLLRLMYTLWKNETMFDPVYQTSGFQETKPLFSGNKTRPVGTPLKTTADSQESAALDELPYDQSTEALFSVSQI